MLIIITVGTSLLENTGGEGRNDTMNNQNLKDFLKYREDNFKDRDRDYDQKKAQGLAQKLSSCLLGDSEDGKVGCLNHELQYRASSQSNMTDALPQELSYLALLADALNSGGSSDHLVADETVDVAFLASDSSQGKLTARVLHHLLSCCRPKPEAIWKRFTVLRNSDKEGVFIIEGLQTDDKERFETDGVPNLIATVHELCSRNQYRKIFINFTGGFKGAIPYTTLAANFLPRDKDIRLHYLFHDTPHILELPLYPIGLDFARWHSEAVMLDAARISETYRKQLTPPMANVALRKDPPEHSLPALLKGKYREQLTKDPFQIYSKRVLEQFLGKDSDYYKNLAPLVDRVGSLIWLGDKLPMAADHAANHHHHLLEIAQSLLTPIADENITSEGERPFLNAKERYVLFAALLLHDCGHTLDVVKDDSNNCIPLLTSEVREYHHVLTWLRLGEGKTENGLDWEPMADLKEAVRLVCFYHRRRTGWTQTDTAKDFPYRPDCRFPAPVLHNSIKSANGMDLLKLIALMRFIDGCDTQSRRVGGALKTDLLEKILNKDAATRMVLLQRTATATQRLYDDKSECATAADGFGEEKDWLQRLCCWLKNRTKDEEAASALHKEGVGLSAKLICKTDLCPCQVFLLDTIRLLDEWKLRHGQKPHLLKHEAVRRVRVLPADTFNVGGPWDFKVFLEPARLADNNDKFLVDDKGICAFARQEGFDDARKWIQSEVESELKEKINGEERPVVLDYLQSPCVSGGKWGSVTVIWEEERSATEKQTSDASDGE